MKALTHESTAKCSRTTAHTSPYTPKSTNHVRLITVSPPILCSMSESVRLLREPPVPWHQVKGQDVRLPPLRVDDAGVDGEGDEAKREGDGEGKAHTEREAFAHVEGSKKEEGLEEGIGQWEDELREEGEGTAKVRGPLVVQGLLRQGN